MLPIAGSDASSVDGPLELSVVLDAPNLLAAITEYRSRAPMGRFTTTDSLSASGVPELISEDVWERAMHDVRCGCYDIVVLFPPTWSFKEARGLRGLDGRDSYGLARLQFSDKRWVRAETFAWLRACECLRRADSSATFDLQMDYVLYLCCSTR